MYERGWVIPPQATGGGVAEPAARQARKWLSHLRQVEHYNAGVKLQEKYPPELQENRFKTPKDMKTVFVTVGTTKFDQLIESITSPENVQVRKCVLNDGTQPFASTNFYFYSYVINMSMCCISMQQNNRILTRNSNPLKTEMYRICS